MTVDSVIAVNMVSLGDRDTEYVQQCLRSGWISSTGPFLERFEAGWASTCGRRHGVAVSSGTAALQLAIAALDLHPGDEVIVPAFTIVSCALAVVYQGAIPVLVDSDPETGCLDTGQLESRIGARTRAIMPVHMYGHPVDMDRVVALADKHGLAIVEDAAEAHGAEYLTGHSDLGGGVPRWRRCGGFGEASCFSFYANKAVTTGEGGMVLVDDDRLAARLRLLRNLASSPDRRFFHEELGFNFRLTNLQAALGLAQVERIDAIVARKRQIGFEYRSRLGALPGVAQPVEREWARSIFWMYGLVLADDHPLDAEGLGKELLRRGVETRPYFLGLHEQPALRKRGLFEGERYPVAERLARRGLYLPSGLGLTEPEMDRVCAAVHAVLGGGPT